VGVTTLAAFLPAWRGTAITVRKALDSYGITATYGQGALDRFIQRLSKLPRIPSMALRNLARRKVRNLVTVGAIALATAAFLAAQSTSDSVNFSIENAYDVYGADAWVWFNAPVTQGFAATLRSLPEVVEVEPWANGPAAVADVRVTMWGLPPDTRLYQYKLTQGRWLDENEPYGTVISSRFAETQGYRLGSRIELRVGGQNAWLTVKGMVNDNAQGLQSSSRGKIFIPLSTANALLRRGTAADFFSVRFQAHDGPSVEAALARIERKYRDLTPGMMAAYSDKAASLEASKILTILLYAMTIIVGTIGGIGIANTLTLNVLERRREIGVMRAVGGRNVHLMQVFLTEALAMGGLGFVIGLALGLPMARLLVWLMEQVLFPLDFVFPVEMVVTALLFTLFLTMLASIGPALGAARLKVSQALRYE
jgi:putative ABC transport system permease protein